MGVLVDPEPADACRVFDEVGLDLLQLHGTILAAGRTGRRLVTQAFRLGAAGLQPVAQYLRECRQLVWPLVLLDASVPGVYGGTGQTADWSAARRYQAEIADPPLGLAGGLGPTTWPRRSCAAGVPAVDAASGVEARPGVKDPVAVAAFVRAGAAGDGGGEGLGIRD